jgi:LysR family transcriptional activator of nhaA
MGPGVGVKAFNHLLGVSGVTFFAQRGVASRLARRFPASLGETPMLLPTTNTALRRSLDEWFGAGGFTPRVVAEFEDSALLKAFGERGLGVFPAPTVIEADVCRQYRVGVVGRAEGPVERFYAISLEKKLKHPAVVAISEAARRAGQGGGTAE